MKKILFLFIFISIFTSGAYTQQVWTLQNCIDYALTNNIQIKQQQLAEQLAKINLVQSKLSVLPSLNGGVSHAYNFGQTIDMYTNQFATNTVQSDNFYLSTNFTVFNGFQLLNGIKQSKIDLQTSRYDLEKMMNDISLNISIAYLQILYSIEIFNNAKNQVAVTQQQIERTKKLVEVGTVTKGTLLTLESQAALEELEVVTTQNNLDLAYLTLTQMLDLSSTEGFQIDIPLLTISADSATLNSTATIFTYASNVQPEIKSAELKLKSAELGLAIARGMRSPSISLRGSMGTGYSGASQRIKDVSYDYYPGGFTNTGDSVFLFNRIPTYEDIPFNDQIKENKNQSISFNLAIPLFNNWQVNASVSKAKIAIKSAAYTLQTTKNTLYKTIQQAYADAAAALNKYKSSKKSVEALKESFKYTEQKFDVGMLNTTEYNDAKNKLSEAESNLLQAKYEYVFRLKVLDFYMGKPIELK